MKTPSFSPIPPHCHPYPQGVRKRISIYFTKLFGIFYGIFNQQLQLRASSEGSKVSNDVLDSLLNLIEEDNSEISLIDIKHLLLVIDYLFKTVVQSKYSKMTHGCGSNLNSPSPSLLFT